MVWLPEGSGEAYLLAVSPAPTLGKNGWAANRWMPILNDKLCGGAI
jgi:hypothetical protein